MRLFLPLIMLISASAYAAPELTLYTSRKSHLIEPVLEAYEKKTGVKIKHINGKAGVLIQRLRQEGKNTPADLFLTVDVGNLTQAADLGLLTPLKSKRLTAFVPAGMRDADNRWVAVSLRARTLFYNTKKVKPAELKGYADLADPKWKGRLCLRTSRKVYNQSLVASMINQNGEPATENVVKGWVANLAQPVYTSDTLLLKAINQGVCQVGVANTYYFARLQKKNEAPDVAVHFPKLRDGGVHVNVSGAGVVAASKNQKAAKNFLEWLVSTDAQRLFADLNDEYPVVEKVQPSSLLKSWGRFKKEKGSLKDIGISQRKAVQLMDRVKYR